MVPIKVALGSQFAINSGIEANNSKGSFPFAKRGLTSKNTGICFPIMINPIAASIPWTADKGKKSISFPSLKTPKRIWTKPAITIAPSAKCQPCSPPPNSVTAPATMTINPAAGPLIVNRDPLNKLTTIPPIMAVNKPMMGGKSEALAIPKLKGKANKKTINPEAASDAMFSFNPAKPSLGVFFIFFFRNIC